MVGAVERFGRKKVLICGAIGQAVCMFVVALVGSQTSTGPNGEKSLGVGVGIVVLLFSFIFFYKPYVPSVDPECSACRLISVTQVMGVC